MKLALIGDIGLFGRFSYSENKDLEEYFLDVKALFDDHDFVVGNLETPFVDKGKPYGAKSAHLFSNPENVELLNYLKIGAVSLANNHIYDYGLYGLKLTRETLYKAGIKYYGIDGLDLDYVDESNKLKFFGYCGYRSTPLNAYAKCLRKKNYVNGFSVSNLVGDFKKSKLNGYLPIFSLHDGIEHVNYPDSLDIRLARHLASSNDYILHGHHPHVMQGVEYFKGSLLSYSLGNFCFDDVYNEKSDLPLVKMTENNKSSIVLSVEIHKNKIISYETIPLYMGDKKMILNQKSVMKKMQRYSEALQNIEVCQELREKELFEYYSSRKYLRDFNWYLKRFNINSIRMILNSRRCKKLHKRHYLRELGLIDLR